VQHYPFCRRQYLYMASQTVLSLFSIYLTARHVRRNRSLHLCSAIRSGFIVTSHGNRDEPKVCSCGSLFNWGFLLFLATSPALSQVTATLQPVECVVAALNSGRFGILSSAYDTHQTEAKSSRISSWRKDLYPNYGTSAPP
jgi:hypothetical protein